MTATGVAAGVNLSWSANTATDLAGYNVYRSATATGTFTKVNAALLTGTTYADTAAPVGVAVVLPGHGGRPDGQRVRPFGHGQRHPAGHHGAGCRSPG